MVDEEEEEWEGGKEEGGAVTHGLQRASQIPSTASRAMSGSSHWSRHSNTRSVCLSFLIQSDVCEKVHFGKVHIGHRRVQLTCGGTVHIRRRNGCKLTRAAQQQPPPPLSSYTNLPPESQAWTWAFNRQPQKSKMFRKILLLRVSWL